MAKNKISEVRRLWKVPSDLTEVQKLSALVMLFYKPLGLSDACCFDVRLCLEEALINAIKYGHQLKRDQLVDVEVGYDDKKIWLRVEDQGRGFNVKKIDDCTRGENLLKGGGRGIYLIHQLMDEVKYNAKGNSVLMTKFIQEPS